MPKSFVSSRLPLSALLLVSLVLLTAGCTDKKNVDYSAPDVQAAFATEGIALYGQNQSIPQDPLVRPPSAARPLERPLTTALDAIHDAVFIPNLSGAGRPTVLNGLWMIVFVFPRVEAAEARVRSFADILSAEQILHTPTSFGYAVKGNVVVDYRAYIMNERIPGYLGEWQSVHALNRKIRLQVAAALGNLP